jgi:DNA-binding SARP family transcriptional activator
LGAYLPAVPGAHAASWSIRVLGTFVVQRNGTDVTPPPGHPSTLVKLLALRAGMSAEEVIDQLWPEVSLEAGRSRLRNLLNRLRDRTGPLVVRHHGRLELDAAASVDMHRFESLANEVLAASPEDRPGLARRGLAIYGGELLPGDRYEDWTAAVRERLRRRYVTLVDLVVEDARQRGDLDEAMAWLDAALLVEPHDEHRYLVAAAVLAQQGRRGAAREMVERALASVADLGVTPTPALLRRAQELGVTMAVDGR